MMADTSSQSENSVSMAETHIEVMDTVLNGTCSFEQLPPLNKKVVRIFVSSTFSDTKEERNALMQHVYPKLAEYSREKYGLEFQVVDMRWGVPEHASDSHSTTDLCLQEIKKCKDVSVGPNFIAIIGNKYGYRPIPNTIEEQLFMGMAETGKNMENSDWPVIEDWYLKDSNAIPPMYILQPISAKIEHYNDKENAKLRKEAKEEWNKTNLRLKSALRQTASQAHQDGRISEEQKIIFFQSVTENEIREGMSDTCLCIIRNIPDISDHLQEENASKFIDILPDTPTLDLEAQNLLKQLRDNKVSGLMSDSNVTEVGIDWGASGANISLETIENPDLPNIAQKLMKDKMNIVKHKEYLDEICVQFFRKVSKIITKCGSRQESVYDEVNIEILQHLYFAKSRCEVLEGRDDLLAEIRNYFFNDENIPLTVYGNSGSGKTSILAKTVELFANWKTAERTESDLAVNYVLISRFLGTTSYTSNLYQMLSNVCQQLCKTYAVEWSEPDKVSDVINLFHSLLGKATNDKPLYVLFDSIDQLLPAYNAYKVNWLPPELPPHVKLVVSTIDEDYDILNNIKDKYECIGGKFLKVTPLGENIGMQVISKYLRNINRDMTTSQKEIVKSALTKCSMPLYVRIAIDHIRRWKSYETPSDDQLEPTVKGAIKKLFEQMELKFGGPLVKHCLAYLTASRHGLSEVELEHIMSLDDDLLSKIYKFWRPPVRRIPPLLWTRVRSEMSNYIVERSADGILVMYWYHRQFIATTKEKYLSDPIFAQYIHEIMADYFLGKWGGGKGKPFKYTETQKNRFELPDRTGSADRKVPAQPYFFERLVAGNIEIRYNKRKLSELPFHLLKCKQYDQLKEYVFFNYEWLYARLKSAGAQSILEELEIFMGADRTLNKDTDLRLLYATMQLIRPHVSKYMESLPLELSGRLAIYLGKSQAITSLVKQCDCIGSKHCPLIPVLSCFETADLGLKQNITIRSTEPWHVGGAVVCTKDFQTMYVLDYQDDSTCTLSSWDIGSGEKLHEFIMDKSAYSSVIDVYVGAVMNKDDTCIIAMFKQKYFEGFYLEKFKENGFVEIISVADGTVLRRVQDCLRRKDFTNPLVYLRDNWASVNFGYKNQLIHLYEDKQMRFGRSHMLTHDEGKYIGLHKTKTRTRIYAGDESEYMATRTSYATVRDFETKEDIGEFDNSESIVSIAISNDDFLILLASSEPGKICIYKLRDPRPGKLYRVKRVLSLPRYERVKVLDVQEGKYINFVDPDDEKKNDWVKYRVSLILSPDNNYVIYIYQNDIEWEGFLWNLDGTFLGRLAEKRPLVARYPVFSYDSAYIVVCKKKKVDIISTNDGQVVNQYDLGQSIRDISVSHSSNQFAALLGKGVVFLDIGKDQRRQDLKKPSRVADDGKSIALLPREIILPTRVHKEIVVQTRSEGMIANWVSNPIALSDTDRLVSARSRKKYALDSWSTPNGNRLIQLHSRSQVIDTLQQEIKYTPRSGETILRTVIAKDTGEAGTESLPIPYIESTSATSEAMDLLPGDRIVTTEHKMKYRVQSKTKGQVQIMRVPSILTSFDLVAGKLRKLHCMTVFQESVVALSNKYLVTCRLKNGDNFVNIYDLDRGKVISTALITGSISCVRISHDDTSLFVATTSMSLYVLSGENFISNQFKIDLLQTGSTKYHVRDIIGFPANKTGIAIKYGPEGLQGYNQHNYIYLDTLEKKKSPPMIMKPDFEDFSKDGLHGIDCHLAMYLLSEGRICKQIPYSNTSVNMQLQVRISDDSRYVVFLDRQDDTIHLVELSDKSVRHLISCFTHTPDLDIHGGLFLRHYGEVVVICGSPLVLLAIKTEQDVKNADIRYGSELERAQSLAVRSVRSKESNHALRPISKEAQVVVKEFVNSLV